MQRGELRALQGHHSTTVFVGTAAGGTDTRWRQESRRTSSSTTVFVGAAGSRFLVSMDDVLEDNASEGRGSDDNASEGRGSDAGEGHEAGLYIDLSSLNKAELRELCDTRGISSKGLKNELVARLMEARAEALEQRWSNARSLIGERALPCVGAASPTPAIGSADDPPESAPPSDHPSAPELVTAGPQGPQESSRVADTAVTSPTVPNPRASPPPDAAASSPTAPNPRATPAPSLDVASTTPPAPEPGAASPEAPSPTPASLEEREADRVQLLGPQHREERAALEQRATDKLQQAWREEDAALERRATGRLQQAIAVGAQKGSEAEDRRQRAAAAEEQVADEFQLLSAQHRGERAASEERAADMLLESLEDELLAGEARRAEIDVQRLRLKLKRAQTARRAEGGGDGGRRPCGPPTPPPAVAPRHGAANDDLLRTVRDTQGVEAELAAGGGISAADHLINVGAVADGRFPPWDMTRGSSSSFESRCREEDDRREEPADRLVRSRAPDRWGDLSGHRSALDHRGEARYDDGREELADYSGGPRAPGRWGGPQRGGSLRRQSRRARRPPRLRPLGGPRPRSQRGDSLWGPFPSTRGHPQLQRACDWARGTPRHGPRGEPWRVGP